MKPRTLAVLDAALDLALAGAVGAHIGLAGAFLDSLTPPPSPAVSTRESAFRFAGWGEAAGDSFTAPQETDQTMNADEITTDFLAALARLESGNQPTAVNRREDAHGLYQIRPSYLADANRIMGTNYTLADCHRPAIAEEIVRAYLAHYGDAYAKRTGKPVTREVLARIHNGGPRGAEIYSTVDYSMRYLAELGRSAK